MPMATGQYTTTSEIAFIRNIAWGKSPETRKRKFIEYKNALKQRKDWGDINKAEVFEFIDECIRDCGVDD